MYNNHVNSLYNKVCSPPLKYNLNKIPEYFARALSWLELQNPLRQSIRWEYTNSIFDQWYCVQNVREKGLDYSPAFVSMWVDHENDIGFGRYIFGVLTYEINKIGEKLSGSYTLMRTNASSSDN